MLKRLFQTFQLFKHFYVRKSIARKLLKWRTPKNSRKRKKGNPQVHTPMRKRRKKFHSVECTNTHAYKC